MLSLYEVLGVRPGATPQEIKSAYRQGARGSHPDVAGTREAFQALRAAYETLIDPTLRQRYDTQRAEWLRQLGAMDCPQCAKPNRVKSNRHALCGSCKAELPGRSANPLRERAAELAADLGERLGDQVSALVVDGLEVGFSRLRQRLGIPDPVATIRKPGRGS
jgi:curved DNA-binding protein CbpA